MSLVASAGLRVVDPDREAALVDYRRRLRDYRDVEARLKKLRSEEAEMEASAAKGEANRTALSSVAQVIGEFLREVGNEKYIVKVGGGLRLVVGCRRAVDRAGLKQGTRIALDMTTYTIMRILPREVSASIFHMAAEDPGDISYSEIGGLSSQLRAIREGVLLYGPPGTGKTLLARAIASQLDCAFIKVAGSAIVQRYIGESAKLVRDLFLFAKDRKPAVIFIDEVDAIGAKRLSGGTSTDREVQRTLMELLNQMDGFDALDGVKVIMATNRPDTLDSALMRPGRIDRKIEIPLPNEAARLDILGIHAAKMTKRGPVDLDPVVRLADGFSGADLRNVCTEAGLFAIREERDYVVQTDFMKGVRKVSDTKKVESKLEYKPLGTDGHSEQ